jgi:hypothetical protein
MHLSQRVLLVNPQKSIPEKSENTIGRTSLRWFRRKDDFDIFSYLRILKYDRALVMFETNLVQVREKLLLISRIKKFVFHNIHFLNCDPLIATVNSKIFYLCGLIFLPALSYT